MTFRSIAACRNNTGFSPPAFAVEDTQPTTKITAITIIFSDDIVAEMQAHKTDLLHVFVLDRGHVPLLDEPQCIEAIDAFLADLT